MLRDHVTAHVLPGRLWTPGERPLTHSPALIMQHNRYDVTKSDLYTPIFQPFVLFPPHLSPKHIHAA
jgi:hypothetical protein